MLSSALMLCILKVAGVYTIVGVAFGHSSEEGLGIIHLRNTPSDPFSVCDSACSPFCGTFSRARLHLQVRYLVTFHANFNSHSYLVTETGELEIVYQAGRIVGTAAIGFVWYSP